MKHIVYISGTRADDGLMRKVLKAIDQDSQLRLSILATGMHFTAFHRSMAVFGRHNESLG